MTHFNSAEHKNKAVIRSEVIFYCKLMIRHFVKHKTVMARFSNEIKIIRKTSTIEEHDTNKLCIPNLLFIA